MNKLTNTRLHEIAQEGGAMNTEGMAMAEELLERRPKHALTCHCDQCNMHWFAEALAAQGLHIMADVVRGQS